MTRSSSSSPLLCVATTEHSVRRLADVLKETDAFRETLV
jgi:hypothetical protein